MVVGGLGRGEPGAGRGLACALLALGPVGGRTREQAEDVERLIRGHAPAIRELRREIAEVARSPIRSVLVLGETGTGKDLVPRALLRCSTSLRGGLVVFNCPAVPADHLESELFGTARGAYPGAVERPGVVERAEGGVLVLDEIAAMPLAHQGKVLRLLEEGDARRLGASRGYRASATFVAATNEDLPRAIAEARFREDLYYRLVQDAVLRVPPLRARLEDVPLLAEHFRSELPGAPPLDAGAMRRLLAHAWPGNVRELRAVVRSAARLARARIGAGEVRAAMERLAPGAPRPLSGEAGSAAGAGAEARAPASFAAATLAVRRRLLVEALVAAGGNRTRAGVLLGMHAAEDGSPPGAASEVGARALDLRARKRAHRNFRYWWERLVETG